MLNLRDLLAARLVRRSGRTDRGLSGRPMVEALEDRCLLATIFWDGGPSGLGTNWHDAANWAGDVLPGANDDAVIDVAPDPTIAINAPVTVRKLTCTEAVTLASTLSVALPSTIDRGLAMTAGMLTGDGDVTLGGSSQWSAGVMSGAGATVIAAGGSMTVNSGGLQVVLDGRSLTNHGALAWTGGSWGIHSAAVYNEAGGTFEVSSTAGMSSIGSTGRIINRGILSKTGTGITTFSSATTVALENRGTVDVRAGRLELAAGTNFATMTAREDAALHFGAFSAADGSTFSGDGQIAFNGTLTGFGAVSLAGSDMVLAGGTLTGAGTFTVEGTLGWWGGAMSGAGITRVASGGRLIVDSESFAVTQDGRQLVNGAGGLVHWMTGFWNLGATTATTIANEFGAVMEVSSSEGMSTVGTSSRIVNHGTLNKTGSGIAFFQNGANRVRIENHGAVNVQEGTLRVHAGENTSNMQVSTGATLEFLGDYALADGASISGPGRVSISGTLSAVAGTATLSGADIVHSGVSMSGAGTFALTGTLTWRSGVMEGAGTTRVAAGGRLVVDSGGIAVTQQGRQLVIENDGLVHWMTGFWFLGQGTTITNEVGGVLEVTSGAAMTPLDNSSRIVNHGTLRKAGPGVTTFQNGNGTTRVRIENHGAVLVGQGTMWVAAGESTAFMGVSAGAALVFTVEYSLADGSLITGPGRVTINGTFSAASGSATLAGTDMELGANSMTGAGTFVVAGTLTWRFGVMEGAGTTVIAPGGRFVVDSGGWTVTLQSRQLINQAGGFVHWKTGGWHVVSATLTNELYGTLEVESAGGMGGDANGRIVNHGELVKTGPTDTFIGTISLDNQGVARVGQGMLTIQRTPQVSGETLTGGTWIVESIGTLELPGAAIRTNQATVRLEGPGSAFPDLSPLHTNAGTLVLANGRGFTFGQPAPSTFLNSGVFIVEDGDTTVPVGVTFSNTGEVRAANGEVSFAGPVTQVVPRAPGQGHEVTGGSWVAIDGGRISIPWATRIGALGAGAAVTLRGTGGSTFVGLSYLDQIDGTISIDPGAALTLNVTGECWVTGLVSVRGGFLISMSTDVHNAGEIVVSGGMSVEGTLINESGGRFTSSSRFSIYAGGLADFRAGGIVSILTGDVLIEGGLRIADSVTIGADTTLASNGFIEGGEVAFSTHLLWKGAIDVVQVVVLDNATVDLDGSAGFLELRGGAVKQFGLVRWNGAPIAGDPVSEFVLVSQGARFEARTTPQFTSRWTAPGTTSPGVRIGGGLVRVFGGGTAEILPLTSSFFGRIDIEAGTTLRTTDPGLGTVNIAQGAAVVLVRPSGFNNTLETGTWNIAGRLDVVDGNNASLPIYTNAAILSWRDGFVGGSVGNINSNTGTFSLENRLFAMSQDFTNSGTLRLASCNMTVGRLINTTAGVISLRSGAVLIAPAGSSNDGGITVEDGARLTFTGGGENNNTLIVRTGGLIEFDGDFNHNPAGGILGSGDLHFDSGTHQFLELTDFHGVARLGDGSTGGVDTRILLFGELVLDNGSFLQDAAIESGTAVVASAFTWNGGTLSAIRVEPGATLTISGGHHYQTGLFEIVNHGTIDWTAGDITLLDNTSLPPDLAWLTNHGTVNLAPNGTARFDRTLTDAHPTIQNHGAINAIGKGEFTTTTIAGMSPGSAQGVWTCAEAVLLRFDAANAPPRDFEWVLDGTWEGLFDFWNAANGAVVDLLVLGEVDGQLFRSKKGPGPWSTLTLAGTLTARDDGWHWEWNGPFNIDGGTLILEGLVNLAVLWGGGTWTNAHVRVSGEGSRVVMRSGVFMIEDTEMIHDSPPNPNFLDGFTVNTDVSLFSSSIHARRLSVDTMSYGTGVLRLFQSTTVYAASMSLSDVAEIHVGSTCSLTFGGVTGPRSQIYNFGEVTVVGEGSELLGYIETGPEGGWVFESPFDGPSTHVTIGEHFAAPNVRITGGATVTFLSGATIENLLLEGTIEDDSLLTVTESFEWMGGSIMGAGAVMIASDASWLMTNPGSRLLARDLVNEGSAAYSEGSLTLDGASLRNAAGALFDASAAAGISASGGAAAFVNEGEFAVTGAQPFVLEILFDNQGTVATTGAPVQFNGGLSQLVGDVLTGGDWHILPGTTIGLPLGVLIRVIGAGAKVTLDGQNAVWDSLAALAEIRGALALRNGATFIAAGNLLNAGVIDLGLDALRVTGVYTQAAAGRLRVEVSGPATYGRIIATGSAHFDGAFEAQYVGGFTPPEFSRYGFLAASSVTGSFASFTAPAAPAGDTSVLIYNGANIELLSTDLADFNFDGTLDIFDFLEFQNLFAAGDPRADLDTSTGPRVFDIFDFLAFQNLFVDG